MCCVGMSVPCVACERVVGAGAVCMYAVCAGLCCCIRDVFLFSSLGCLMWFFLRGGGRYGGGVTFPMGIPLAVVFGGREGGGVDYIPLFFQDIRIDGIPHPHFQVLPP